MKFFLAYHIPTAPVYTRARTDNGPHDVLDILFQDVYVTLSCKKSIRFGDRLMLKRCLIFIWALFIVVGARGQYGSYGVTDARSLGMGNTYTATTYDLYSIGKNPGLLAKTDAPCKLTVIFPNLTAQHYGVGKTLSTFDYYTTNKPSESGIVSLNREKFKLALENNGKLFVDGLIGFFSVAYHPSEQLGSFAFSMSDYLTGYMDIPDVILDINYGSEVPGGSFSLDNFDFKAWWIRTYTLSYSRYLYHDKSIYRSGPGLIRDISAGISAKYVTTYAYTDIGVSAQANYSTATQTLSGSYQAHAVHSFSDDLGFANSFNSGNEAPPGFMRLTPAGKGYAFDIGAAARLKQGWTIGLALTDIGMIRWKGAAKKSDFDGYIDISGVIDYETIDSLAAQISLVSESNENFNTPMPAALRLGASLEFDEIFRSFPGELLLGIDYNQGLNNQPSNYTDPRFSMGFEYRYKPGWPILLGGYTIDFLGISRGALGLGYKTWLVDVYVSTIDVFSLVSGGDRASASLVARWKIFCGHVKNNVPECF